MTRMGQSLFSAFVFFVLCGSLVAQPQMVPGQKPRQSQAGGLIFRCLFDEDSDVEDNDEWLNYYHWTRKQGLENGIFFPDHLVVRIVEDPNPNPFGKYVLRANVDGGAAALFSPKIPVRAGMSYTVSVYVETRNLAFSEVSILALFYGADTTKPIREIESKKVTNTNGWQQLVIGPIPADMPNVQSLAVGLLVVPPTGRQDYGAQANFTCVEIRESPNITLEMADAHHLFFTPRDIDVRCHYRGLDPQQRSVWFILEDPFGRVIGTNDAGFMIGNHPAERFVVTPLHENDVLHGIATWKNLPLRFPGFYRIRVATPESYIQTLKLPADQTFDDPLEYIEPLTFAVMSPDSFYPGGEFGWTLDGWSPDEITAALPTLKQSGLSHLKLPAWLSEEASPQQWETLQQLCKNLSTQRVRLIGLLDPVPKSITSKIAHRQVNARSMLESNPRLWGDSLQPVLHSLSLLIKDWQWSADTDSSLIDLFFDSGGKMSSSGTDRSRAFHKLFDQEQFGFGVGMTWNWYQDVPSEQLPIPNFYLNFSLDASISPEDAATSLAAMSQRPFQQCVSVSPLPADDYALDVRVKDFVQNLVLMKATGINTISLTAPKDEQTGVLRSDGTPGELYLPWRTTATLLSGARLLGSITLPNRSQNYCFDRGGGKCLMVVWNDEAAPDDPVLETLYLGNVLDRIDVWGRHTNPEQNGNNQIIQVTQTPVFVTGLNINVARFRLNMQTGVKTISSKPNQTYVIPYSYENESVYPVSVQITPEGPRQGDWTITPPLQMANLEAGHAAAGAFNLTLSSRADTGLRRFHYNVKLSGAESAEFAVYDEMMIGDPNVYMEFVTRMTSKGDLEVIQVFVNNSENVYTYGCRLNVLNRAIPPFRIQRQGFGRVERIYTISRGRALLDSGVTEAVLFANPVPDAAGGGALGEPMVYTIPLVE